MQPPSPAPAGAAVSIPSSTLRSELAELFSLDLRSLALFRITLGLLLIWDLVIRSTDLTAHYTDDGVLPRPAIPPEWPQLLHSLGGSAAFEGFLFVVAGVFALALLLGYRTLLATFASWLLLHSLHARNYLILQGGDGLLRLLVFWGMFLPLGERWSVDAALRPVPRRPRTRVFSAASVAYPLQICFVYWFGVAMKTDPVWWPDGTAVYYALSIEQFATPLGKYLLAYPELLRILTYATLALEVFGPILLLVPVFTGPIRFAVVASFLVFHLIGLGLCMELGPFPYVCAVAWVALLPGWFWERKWLASAGRWFRTQLAAVRNPMAPSLRIAAEKDADSAPQPAVVTAPAAMNVLASLFLIYVLWWNFLTVSDQEGEPSTAQVIGNVFGLGQTWNMFAPAPLRNDGWYLIMGELRDGHHVDLFRDGAPMVWEKPELVSAMYKNERWRKYMMNLYGHQYERYRLYYLQYLQREWDGGHTEAQKLDRIKLYFMLKETKLPGEPTTPKKVLLSELNCSAK